jgi:hypothetical protein
MQFFVRLFKVKPFYNSAGILKKCKIKYAEVPFILAATLQE